MTKDEQLLMEAGTRVCLRCLGTGVIFHECGDDVCCCAESDDEDCLRCDGTGRVPRDL